MHTHMYACAYALYKKRAAHNTRTARTNTDTHMHTHTHMHMHTYTDMQKHERTHARMHAHACMRTRAHARTLHAFVYGAAPPAEAAPAAADAACMGADLALMADMTTTNAMTILPKMEGGLAGKCGSCIMANSAGGPDGVAAACTAGQQHDKL